MNLATKNDLMPNISQMTPCPARNIAKLLNIMAAYHKKEDSFNFVLPKYLQSHHENIDSDLTAFMTILSDCVAAINLLHSSRSKPLTPKLRRVISIIKQEFILIDPKRYKKCEFSDELFLEIHSKDIGLFGGKDNHARWSGMMIAENISEQSSSLTPLNTYNRMIFSIIRNSVSKKKLKLLIKTTNIKMMFSLAKRTEDHLKLKLHSASSLKDIEEDDDNEKSSINVDFVTSNSTFNITSEPSSGSAFFNVNPQLSSGLILQLNSSHPLFKKMDLSDPKMTQLLFESWAAMEDDALTNRKQLLEDIRYDWGRYVRDMIQDLTKKSG